MINFDFKMFFDRPQVIRALKRAKKTGLRKAAGLYNKVVRRSIRRSKKPSAPGKPPHAHGNELKMIYFAYDPPAESFVSGPVQLGLSKVPGILERGGQSTAKRWTTVKGVKSKSKKTRIMIRKRPFAAPALKATAPQMPEQFRNSLVKS